MPNLLVAAEAAVPWNMGYTPTIFNDKPLVDHVRIGPLPD